METSGPLRYRDGYKYQVADRWSVVLPITGQAFRVVDSEGYVLAELSECGRLTVHAGYAWDGASGPTIDTRSTMRGSLAHDVLYQAMRDGSLPQECRQVADRILRDLCEQDGMTWVRANIWERAVRWFAGGAAKRQKSAPLVAP